MNGNRMNDYLLVAALILGVCLMIYGLMIIINRSYDKLIKEAIIILNQDEKIVNYFGGKINKSHISSRIFGGFFEVESCSSQKDITMYFRVKGSNKNIARIYLEYSIPSDDKQILVWDIEMYSQNKELLYHCNKNQMLTLTN